MGPLAHLQQPLQHGHTVDAHRSIRRTEDQLGLEQQLNSRKYNRSTVVASRLLRITVGDLRWLVLCALYRLFTPQTPLLFVHYVHSG